MHFLILTVVLIPIFSKSGSPAGLLSSKRLYSKICGIDLDTSSCSEYSIVGLFIVSVDLSLKIFSDGLLSSINTCSIFLFPIRVSMSNFLDDAEPSRLKLIYSSRTLNSDVDDGCACLRLSMPGLLSLMHLSL